jgi:hypothetical protein
MEYEMTERKQSLAEIREQKYVSRKQTKHAETHEKLADAADTAVKTTRVVAAAAVAGAAVATPTGLTAVGVTLGLVSTPVIVTAAPILVCVAGGTAALSAAASLYSKFKKRR